jgi:class 3 adenylate cyclase
VLTHKNETIIDQNLELEQLNEALRESNSKIMDAMTELEQINNELNNSRVILEEEKAQSDKLLLNILPARIADLLKDGEDYIAERFQEVSIVFIDIVDFTKLSSGVEPEMIVDFLNGLFTRFDKISEKYGLEKIKTIGDSYMAVSGIPVARSDNAEAAALMALEVMEEINNYNSFSGQAIMLRIGIDCGPVVAGVIGEKKFIYDLWGDAVNTASRMEQYGAPGEIQITDRFRLRLANGHKQEQNKNNGFGNHSWMFRERGLLEIKGKGTMHTYFLKACTDNKTTSI